MAIKLTLNWSSHGVKWRSGHFYTFRYNAFRQDPNPTIILMYKVFGVHPKTGHQHRYIQAININYIPKAHRKIFVNLWAKELDKNKGNVEFTWQLVSMRFPYLEMAVRRYMLKPVYRIQQAKYIPMDQLDDVVIGSWSKDFNKKVNMDLASKQARVMGRGVAMKKKYNRKWGLGGLKSFFGAAKGFFSR